MSLTEQIINGFIEAIEPKKTPSAYDTPATVTRVEGDTAWVHIPGGIDETPVKLTVSAQAGDTVQVRVGGGTAWMVGNASAPPTDDRVANIANNTAKEAYGIAESAVKDAETAHKAAESAVASAERASSAANAAQASADNANEYAARALGNLSTVQSVAETLNWITEHGTMTITSDQAIDPTHVYFVIDANGDYVVGSTHYSVVTEPDADDLSSYYELSIDESLQNYVGTHLALTAEGLWILPASSGYKVLIATGNGPTYTSTGTYIIDDGGDTVAYFGSSIVLGYTDSGDGNLLAGQDGIKIRDGTNELAIFSKDGIQLGIAHVMNMPYAKMTNSGISFFSYTNIAPVSEYEYANILKTDRQATYDSISFRGDENWTYTTDKAVVLGSKIKLVWSVSNVERSKVFTHGVSETFEAPADATIVYDGDRTFTHTKYSGEEQIYPNPRYKTVVYDSTYSDGGALVIGEANKNPKGANTLMVGSDVYAKSPNQAVFGRANISDDNGDYVIIAGNGYIHGTKSNAFAVKYDGDVEIALETNSAAGTVDGDLYAAITALGWESEVIV